MSQTCQYRHSPNLLLVAHTGSARGSDHSLDAPVVCKVLSMCMTMLVKSRVRGSEIKLSQGCLGMLQPPMPGRTVNAQKVCITLSLVAKATQGGAVLLESEAATWFSEDVRRVALALDVLRLDGAVGDLLADLKLAAVNAL
eukprot:6205357-Pleurochrysis_carterae.AAC.1